MCGILAAFNRTAEQKDETFFKSIEIVKHRGPDNLGFYSDDIAYLAHARLSIIGIAESGNQPFHFQDLMMTYNGEIFNYIELRDELVKCGYDFKTESDTEVIIKAYAEWGGDCFAKFNGMWALVIYDKSQKKIIVSRDRYGQKPLFFMQKEGVFYVASEFQQLVPFSNSNIDYDLVLRFLKEGTYEGEGRTFIQGIQEFPKAHYTIIDNQGNIETHRYWNYWDGDVYPTDSSSVEKFEEVFLDAVKIRLRCDVPYGVLLSGGVDSTLVAHYSRKLAGDDHYIPAFTYGSNDAEDESKYAKSVANKLKMPITIKEQDQNPEEYTTRLRRLVQNLGRGHSSPAIISVDYLYEEISNNDIKVALDGQGADELLAGYKTYFFIMLFHYFKTFQYRQIKLLLKDMRAFGIFRALVMHLRNKLPPIGRKVMRLVYGYESLFRDVKQDQDAPIIQPTAVSYENKNVLNRYLIWQHNLGLENLLYYGDIVAMNNSVENRSPFMDHRLIDFVLQYDDKLKLNGAIDKFVLRRLPVYKEYLEELERVKIGFSSDIKSVTVKKMIEDLKVSPILSWPIFRQNLVKRLNDKTFESYKFQRLLFRLYQVHLWNEVFIQKGK